MWALRHLVLKAGLGMGGRPPTRLLVQMELVDFLVPVTTPVSTLGSETAVVQTTDVAMMIALARKPLNATSELARRTTGP